MIWILLHKETKEFRNWKESTIKEWGFGEAITPLPHYSYATADSSLCNWSLIVYCSYISLFGIFGETRESRQVCLSGQHLPTSIRWAVTPCSVRRLISEQSFLARPFYSWANLTFRIGDQGEISARPLFCWEIKARNISTGRCANNILTCTNTRTLAQLLSLFIHSNSKKNTHSFIITFVRSFVHSFCLSVIQFLNQIGVYLVPSFVFFFGSFFSPTVQCLTHSLSQ